MIEWTKEKTDDERASKQRESCPAWAAVAEKIIWNLDLQSESTMRQIKKLVEMETVTFIWIVVDGGGPASFQECNNLGFIRYNFDWEINADLTCHISNVGIIKGKV